VNIIYVLIPIAIVFIGVAIMAFFWAVRHNQFDDLERHALDILMDDETASCTFASPEKTSVNEHE
jgi:cbb3-type cytochrome oxidase maturation protein